MRVLRRSQPLMANPLQTTTTHPGPLLWATRLADRYEKTRHPVTGLGGYQFSQFIEGDRAQKQFGPEFGPDVLEGTILGRGAVSTRYGTVAVAQLTLAQRLGPSGADFLRASHADLTALATRVYEEQTHTFQPMLTDGRRLTPADVKRPGYFPPAGFEPWHPTAIFLWSYALAFRFTRDPLMATMVQRIARGLRLGDFPSDASTPPQLNLTTDSDDPILIFALLDLHRATPHQAYLSLASRIADNFIANRFHHDFFLPTPRHIFAKFDRLEPLALLHLVAALQDRPDAVPTYCAGSSNFTAEHPAGEGQNPWSRLSDDRVLYSQTA